MMSRGTAARAFEHLADSGFLSTLFPEMDQHVRMKGPVPYTAVLSKLDEKFKSGEALEPWLIFSSLFYPYFDFIQKASSVDDPGKLARDAISPACARIQVPRRVQDVVRQILAAQVRLFGLRSGKFKPRTIIRKSYFNDAFTLFEVIAPSTPGGCELIEEWKKLPLSTSTPRKKSGNKKPRRRRRRGPRPPAGRPAG
jgi:hypothetical protein